MRGMRKLGVGGMATVYLAHDIKHERDVAITLLKRDLAAVIGADRFVVPLTALGRPDPSRSG